jgi:hypothetical protein
MSNTVFIAKFACWDDRVAGFMYGYLNRPCLEKDLSKPEFMRGWDEGAALRIDEGIAQAAALARRAQP